MHNLYTNENGQTSAAFATDKSGLPWHNLGTMVNHAMTWNEIYKTAKLDFSVEKRPIFFKNPLYTSDNTNGAKGYKVPGQFVVCRTDVIGENSALGIVGSTYHCTQNYDMGKWVERIINQIDGAVFEAAGVLGKGERVWCVARIPINASIGKDEHKTYLTFLTSHDGSMSNIILATDVRCVCQNTINFALNSATKNEMIKVKHTKGATEKLNQATAGMQEGITKDVKALKEKYEKLASAKINQVAFKKTMNKIFGEKWETSDSKSGKALEIAKLFNDNDGNAFPEQEKTGMALLNAVTNYVDHTRPTRVTANSGYKTQDQARSDSAMVGTGAQLKTASLNTILEVIEMDNKEVTHNPNPSVQMDKNKALDNILTLID